MFWALFLEVMLWICGEISALSILSISEQMNILFIRFILIYLPMWSSSLSGMPIIVIRHMSSPGIPISLRSILVRLPGLRQIWLP